MTNPAFPHLKPYALAVIKPSGEIVEVISYPYPEGGSLMINARRTINDPTSMAQFFAHELHDLGKSAEWQSAYRDGFIHGFAIGARAVHASRR